MAARLGSLCDDSVHTLRFERSCLGDRRGARQQENAYRLFGIHNIALRQPEMKARNLGPGFSQYGEVFPENSLPEARGSGTAPKTLLS